MEHSFEPTLSPSPIPSSVTETMVSIPSSPQPPKKKTIRKHVPLIAGHVAEGQTYKPQFKFTRFFTATSNVDITRNITNQFLSKPGQEYLKTRMEDNRKKDGPQTPIVVIHPGSRNLRVGLQSDAVPKTIPSVLARKFKGPIPNDLNPMNIVVHPDMKPSKSHPPSQLSKMVEKKQDTKLDDMQMQVDTETTPDLILESREVMDNVFKRSMKQASLRIPPNAISLVQNFNSSTEGTEIPAMNDPHCVDWVHPTAVDTPALLVGQRALDVVVSESSDDFHYRLIWPFYMRTWQFSSATSIMLWRQDVAALFRYAMEACGVKPSEAHVALVVPDVFHSSYLEALLHVIFEDLEVNQVLIGHESIMTCYGAGLSTACVVDIGATCSTVALVEQGELIATSIGMYGGDQVTLELIRRLQSNRFPIQFDLEMPWDWKLAESLKEKWCTANESELGTQVYDLYRRVPNRPTQKFQVKVYNEVYMAPLSLFYPCVLPLQEYLTHCARMIPSDPSLRTDSSIHSITNMHVASLLAAFSSTPLPTLVPALDKLVSQLLLDQTTRSEERLKKFSSSILVVGGASRVVMKLLESRLKSIFPSVQVTPPPRDMNPGHVAWKGLSVATRLEAFSDYWIRVGEWRAYGAQGCWNTKAVLSFLEQQTPAFVSPPSAATNSMAGTATSTTTDTATATYNSTENFDLSHGSQNPDVLAMDHNLVPSPPVPMSSEEALPA